MKIIKTLLVTILIQINLSSINAQEVTVELVNQIVDSLIGDQNYTDIPEFETLEDVCYSHYFTCDPYNKILGLNFQFSNLTGIIPVEINKLSDLEYINFEYNYLKGKIPEGLSEIENLEEISFAGNFLEGPLPNMINSSASVDLKQNSIREENKKLKRKYNIINQINLDSCRSPDNIFLKTNQDYVELDAVTPNNEANKGFKVVDQMPMFPGCENEMSYDKKQECATNLFLQFIYGNLIYPTKDQELGLEGMAVIKFVVLNDGQIADAEVVRNPGLYLGNAILWMVNRMNYLCDRWSPGKQGEDIVKVVFTLPVKFKLE